MRRRRHHRRHGLHGSTASGCHPMGLKRNGRLKKGFRWAKGRKGCAIPAK